MKKWTMDITTVLSHDKSCGILSAKVLKKYHYSAYDRRRAGFPLSGDPAGISVPGTEKRHVCAAFRISSLSGKSMAVFRREWENRLIRHFGKNCLTRRF